MANKLITVLKTTTIADTGPAIYLLKEDTRNVAYQVTLTGTGAITANIAIEVSNDRVGWISDSVSEIQMSGDNIVSKGFAAKTPWAYTRARVISITGTDAGISVTVSVGGAL